MSTWKATFTMAVGLLSIVIGAAITLCLLRIHDQLVVSIETTLVVGILELLALCALAYGLVRIVKTFKDL